MNPEVQKFVLKHKEKLTGRVLEVGGLDVNGTLREIIPNALVTDMRPGRNVDHVCNAEDLIEEFGEQSFDSVVSTDMLEHAEKWRDALHNMWGVLKDGGWLVMTMASVDKGYHGYPHDYIRLADKDLLEIWPKAAIEKVLPVSVGWTVQKPSGFNPWDVRGRKPTGS